jgi:acyl phosphate:glycerol-3-phosphate acyltransferase
MVTTISLSSIALAILAVLIAFLIGSIPTAYIVGRFRKGVDIRTIGSHNAGTMNVVYQVGFFWGLLVLFIDIVKGVLAVFIATQLHPSIVVHLIAGVFAVLGHAFPPYLKFRGGKGGATCIGVLVYLLPWAAPVYLGMFLLMLLITRYATLSYSVAFICFPFVAWLVYHEPALIIYSIVIPLLPGLMYIPRLVEMRNSAGSWKKVFFRKSYKERY